MNKYFYLLLWIFLISCRGEKHSSNEEIPKETIPIEVIPDVVLTNEELASDAEKTAPWKNEPIIEFTSDEEVKSFLILIDQIRTDLNETIRSAKKYQTVTNIFEKEYAGEISGNTNYKLEVFSDDFDVTDIYYNRFKGVFNFNGFQNITYSIHGSLKYDLKSDTGLGYYYSENTIDGGLSYKNDLGVHILSFHLVKIIEKTSDDETYSGTYKGTVNGKEISGPFPY